MDNAHSPADPQRSPHRILLVSYEFTYSPFSGNGMLARSIAKALLRRGSHLTVWCCRPAEASHADNRHLEPPEIPQGCSDRMQVLPVHLQKQHGWRTLDEHAAWDFFTLQNLAQPHRQTLMNALIEIDAICAVDWTGANAVRSLPALFHDERKNPPLVYMNFRVYSSGIADQDRRMWFDDMERQALTQASVVVALSEGDRRTLLAIATSLSGSIPAVQVLLPPLRGDMHELAHKMPQELQAHLPFEALQGAHHARQPRLITCVARLSQEKQVMRFVYFVEKAKRQLDQLGIRPLLAGATSNEEYATSVKKKLVQAAPNAVILEPFISPAALAAVFSQTALNFHPCAYDAYGMTVIEAAACGVPSVIAKSGVGAMALLGDDHACLPVHMPENEAYLTDDAVQSILQLLNQDHSEKLASLGRTAKKRALAWDEDAYCTSLLRIVDRARL